MMILGFSIEDWGALFGVMGGLYIFIKTFVGALNKGLIKTLAPLQISIDGLREELRNLRKETDKEREEMNSELAKHETRIGIVEGILNISSSKDKVKTDE